MRAQNPDKIRDALRLSGPDRASLLLIIDQFEELWTLTANDAVRREFLNPFSPHMPPLFEPPLHAFKMSDKHPLDFQKNVIRKLHL